MKKKKRLGWVLNLVTICLCVCAIAIGVYSAKNANLNISGEIGFEKHDKTFYIASVTEKMYVDSAWTDVTTNKLCTTMGHSIIGSTDNEAGTDGLTETPIQWYAFAVKGESLGNDNYIYNNTFYTADDASAPKADRWYSLYGVDMSKVSYTGKTFWFIQQYTVAGGFYNSEGTYVTGIMFDSSYNVYSQESQKSSIYTFLNGTDETSYVSKTGILSEDTYEDISARTVDESYKVNFSNDYVTDGKLACKFESKFWLINHEELSLLTNQSPGIGDYKTLTKTYNINAQSGGSAGNGGSWWLRSPYSNDYSGARAVSSNGSFSYGIVEYDAGVRAAFQITI